MNDRWSRSKQPDAFVVAVNHELHRGVGTHDSKSDPLQRVDLRMSAMLEVAENNSPNGISGHYAKSFALDRCIHAGLGVDMFFNGGRQLMIRNQ
jgi:hypothetical protein